MDEIDFRDRPEFFGAAQPKRAAARRGSAAGPSRALSLDEDLGELQGQLLQLDEKGRPAVNRAPEPGRAAVKTKREPKVRTVEFGTTEELKARLIGFLEEEVATLKGEREREAWQPQSPTWPYTRLGFRLHRCINLADEISERLIAEFDLFKKEA